MDKHIKSGVGMTYPALRVLYVIPGEEQAITMSFSRRQAVSVSSLGIHVQCYFLRSRTSPLRVLHEVKRLRREVATFRPDVVHAQFGTMTAFAATVACRQPVVVTFHGSDLNPAPGMSRLRSIAGRILSHISAFRAALVICVSPQLRQRLRYKRQGVRILPCGVNPAHFRPLPQDVCRSKLGWSSNEKVILFNARTDPIGKRLDLAEAAVAHVRQTIPQTRLYVLRGTTRPEDMPLYYNASDALLMTSDYEGSPMVIKEALACNLPVVSVDVGDVAKRLEGVSQSHIASRHPADLASALRRILGDGQRSNGREHIGDVTELAVARELVAVYQEAIATSFQNTRGIVTGKMGSSKYDQPQSSAA